MSTQPTDAELKAMWQLHAADIGGIFCYARAVLAKWGQPAQETKGRKVFVCTHCDGVYADQPVTQCDCMPDENTFTEGWICFDAPAQAAEPVAWLRNTTDPQPHAVTNLKYRSAADVEAGVEYIPVFAAPPPDPAYSEACNLATALFKKHFAHLPDYASGQVVWGLFDSTAGVILQIDNMVSGLVQPPTQTQAGSVPLDEARRLFDAGWKAAALFCDREDVVADGIIGFGACPQFEAAFSAAHGIKGGQHGTE